jgi:hypothetical protein
MREDLWIILYVYIYITLTWCCLCHVFTYIYSLLIEKDIYDRWRVSIRLPFVFVCLSLGDLFTISVRVSSFFSYFTTLLENNLTFLFFCENLVDFNEACLHEATLNLHMYACMDFFLPFNSVSWWQAAFEWSSV